MATSAARPVPPPGGPTASGRPGARRRPLAAGPLCLAVLLVVLGCVSCSTVPPGGNIFAARGASEGDPLSQPYVRILAADPKPNGSPQDIVNGFLAAAASFDDPVRTVARKYLTGEAQRNWSPFDAVTIYDQRSLTSDPLRDGVQQVQVTLRTTLLGTVDGDGHYVPSESTSELNMDFALIKVSGQWRISSAPPGLLLSNDDFKRAYRPFDLTFPAAGAEGLVVDQVRVPINPSESLAKSLVHRLITGPTRPLRGAVRSAFGNNVDVNSVVVDGDVVVIDFTYGIVASVREPADREALSAQLAWTLKPMTEARRIEVRVNGEQFPGGSFVIDPRDYERFDPNVLSGDAQAYFLKHGKLHIIDKDRENPVLVGPGDEQGRRFTDLAVSNDRSPKVAALAQDGGVWVSGIAPGSQWQRWIPGAKPTAPSWDRYGFVWSVVHEGGTSKVYRSSSPSVPPVPVGAPQLEPTDVTAFRVARDGARVAVISDDGHGERVLVGTIDRDKMQVQNLRVLVPAKDGQEISDITWRDASTLLVLTKDKSERELTPWSVTQGIRADTAKAATRIESITAAPDPLPVLAGTADSEILAWDPQKKQWTTLVKNGAGPPVYPLG
ncbi:LpqB family beta-propeller domain-containing protein [Sphaerisporangium aureirubrum]|uniref:LpqB family beta-propeller domain-containing protein n=1 Tax=Sphaerisporangium aureirubrum TaxID=1544736 RepID=A0ABW1NX26_9ACTN